MELVGLFLGLSIGGAFGMVAGWKGHKSWMKIMAPLDE